MLVVSATEVHLLQGRFAFCLQSLGGYAGSDAGHREHAVHAAAHVHPVRDPVVVRHGPVRHVRVEHLHVHARVLHLLRALVRPADLSQGDNAVLLMSSLQSPHGVRAAAHSKLTYLSYSCTSANITFLVHLCTDITVPENHE